MIINIYKKESIDKCILPKVIIKELNLSTKRDYKIAVGKLSVSMRIEPGKSKNMHLPTGVFEKLLLQEGLTLNIWHEDSTINLGPVIGVFISPHLLSCIAKSKPSENILNHVQANNQGNCLLYYFSIDDVDWMGQKIKGYIFIPKTRCWKHCWLPIPDVLYDRGVRFKKRQKPLAKYIRKKLKESSNLKLFNSKHYLSKWQLFQCLAKYNETKIYLPETVTYAGFSDLETMLEKHGFIFLKSYYGSKGTEVMAIKMRNSNYQLTYHEDDLLVNINHQNLANVKLNVDYFFSQNKFIVQEGIELLEIDGNPLDMRILIQKDRKGKWRALYNHVAIAPPKSIITNHEEAAEAKYEDIYWYLSNIKTQQPLPKDSQIHSETIKIATYIEKELGSFGEIGMDMALDKKGKLWFIEANAKPQKDPVPILEDIEGISPQFLLVFEYAKYLTEVK